MPATLIRTPAIETHPHRTETRPATTRQGDALAQLKGRLVTETLESDRDPVFRALLRVAAIEAEALAWSTPFAMLVFPDLLEEKVESVRQYVRRQAAVRRWVVLEGARWSDRRAPANRPEPARF